MQVLSNSCQACDSLFPRLPPVRTRIQPLKGTSSQEKIKRLMEAQGLQRHVPTGQTYYTSYTDIYDWEMYFDGLWLAYYGGESHTIGGLRVFLGSQREDGFISRCVLKQEPPANQSEDGRRIFGYESNELCSRFSARPR